MSKQHISDVYNDAVSITQLRRDIGVLLKKLETEREVKVLRGQNILFIAVSPEQLIDYKMAEAEKNETANYFADLRGKYKTSLSGFVIEDRERMRKKEYYEKDRS